MKTEAVVLSVHTLTINLSQFIYIYSIQQDGHDAVSFASVFSSKVHVIKPDQRLTLWLISCFLALDIRWQASPLLIWEIILVPFVQDMYQKFPVTIPPAHTFCKRSTK